MTKNKIFVMLMLVMVFLTNIKVASADWDMPYWHEECQACLFKLHGPNRKVPSVQNMWRKIPRTSLEHISTQDNVVTGKYNQFLEDAPFTVHSSPLSFCDNWNYTPANQNVPLNHTPYELHAAKYIGVTGSVKLALYQTIDGFAFHQGFVTVGVEWEQYIHDQLGEENGNGTRTLCPPYKDWVYPEAWQWVMSPDIPNQQIETLPIVLALNEPVSHQATWYLTSGVDDPNWSSKIVAYDLTFTSQFFSAFREKPSWFEIREIEGTSLIGLGPNGKHAGMPEINRGWTTVKHLSEGDMNIPYGMGAAMGRVYATFTMPPFPGTPIVPHF